MAEYTADDTETLHIILSIEREHSFYENASVLNQNPQNISSGSETLRHLLQSGLNSAILRWLIMLKTDLRIMPFLWIVPEWVGKIRQAVKIQLNMD